MKHRFGPSSSRRRDRAVRRAAQVRRLLLVSALAGPLGIAAALQAAAVQAQPAKARPDAKHTHQAAATPTHKPTKPHKHRHANQHAGQQAATPTPTPTHHAAPRPTHSARPAPQTTAATHPHRHHSQAKPSVSPGSGPTHASTSGS